MRNVMWKGELAGIIQMDTISDKKGLYGLGPIEFLGGEVMVMDAIFTHHDTYLHMHLITKDLKKMGHLDQVSFHPENVRIFLSASDL